MAGFSTSILVIKNVQMKIELFKNLYKWFLGCRMSSMFFQNPWMKEKTYFFNKSISTEIDLNEKP